MKGKFKLLGHIGLALFLVSVLVLALAPVAQAATAVTEVWVEFPFTASKNEANDSDATNIYMVHFKPTTALERGVDTVTVTWPDGTATMCGTASTNLAFTVGSTMTASHVDFSTDYGSCTVTSATWYDCVSDLTCGGYRTKAKLPIDIAAGTDVWVRFDPSDGELESGSTEGGSFKVYVQTSQDTTPVLSTAFNLGSYVCTDLTPSISPSSAGAAAQYSITFATSSNGALTSGTSTVTVMFPVGTTLPSSISAANVQFSNDDSTYTATGTTPTVDQDRRTVTATVSVSGIDASDNGYMRILSGAGVTNPTTASTDNYYPMIRTSSDKQWFKDSDYSVTAGSPTQVLVCNGEIGQDSNTRYSDDATMINMYSSQIYVGLADDNGNTKAPASAVTVTLSSSSGTGGFFWDDGSTTLETATSCTTISVSVADPGTSGTGVGDQIVYYKDSTAGTHTLTLTASDYTTATWTITVAPAISLYDASNNLVNTYGPSSASPVSETGSTITQKYACDYINDAITAAMAGDTVKLGDGIYEVDDGYINLNEKITLTSVSGASSTTIRNTTEIDKAISVETSGTATNPVIIDDLTFQRLRYATDIDCAIRDSGKDYLTVQNCVFNNIEPDQGAATEAVIWIQNSAALTSITVSDNTFSSCCTTWPNMGSNYDYSGSIVLDFAGGGAYAVSGVTIDGNTLTNCGQYGITIGGYDSTHEGSGYVTNNTITNGQCAINVFNNSNNVNITGNTITDAYSYGVYVESTNNAGLVIKNNTITGCAGEYYLADNTTNHGGAIVVENPTSTSDPVVQYNTLTGSGSYAIKVDTLSSGGADCKYNWFGDATGPYYSALTGANITKSNPNGTGDKITDKVTYYPWLHKSLADVVADNASYQACTIKLVSGWNTLSTPVKLISTADSIDELIPSGMTIGYYYDGGWQQITTGYVLSPCDAVYVKMSAITYVLFKFDASAFTTPSKALDVGWNLVGLAYLSSSGMKDAPAVASVYSTAAGLPGYSQVVSPSVNAAQTDMYGSTSPSSWTYSRDETTGAGTNYMYVGLGYWVYMQNAATLAGFELTPIVPDLD